MLVITFYLILEDIMSIDALITVAACARSQNQTLIFIRFIPVCFILEVIACACISYDLFLYRVL